MYAGNPYLKSYHNFNNLHPKKLTNPKKRIISHSTNHTHRLQHFPLIFFAPPLLLSNDHYLELVDLPTFFPWPCAFLDIKYILIPASSKYSQLLDLRSLFWLRFLCVSTEYICSECSPFFVTEISSFLSTSFFSVRGCLYLHVYQTDIQNTPTYFFVCARNKPFGIL